MEDKYKDERIEVLALARQTMQADLATKLEEEAERIGVYRAGSTGLQDYDNTQQGACPRKTWLRSAGYQIEQTIESKDLMFRGGRASEWVWENLLAPHGFIKEGEITTSWTTDAGTAVTGTPDGFLPGPDGKPVQGVELKCASSLWTVKSVRFDHEPKTDHLAQACHYMWQMDIPFSLIYSSYVNYATFMAKYFPAIKEPLSEHCDYGKTGKLKALVPMMVEYQLTLDDDGILHYFHPHEQRWVKTIVSVPKIKNYYNSLDAFNRLQEAGDSPEQADVRYFNNSRPPKKALSAEGDTAGGGYTICDYCPLQSSCDVAEERQMSFADWLFLVEGAPQTTMATTGQQSCQTVKRAAVNTADITKKNN